MQSQCVHLAWQAIQQVNSMGRKARVSNRMEVEVEPKNSGLVRITASGVFRAERHRQKTEKRRVYGWEHHLQVAETR